MVASGTKYATLSAATLNSNYTGAITRLIRHGNKRRLFKVEPPHLTIKDRKRATISTSRAGFSREEITTITSCPVYTGGVSAYHRYKPGSHIVFDDHIYWAPLIAAHTGMRVSEIGMLAFEQMQLWFGRWTLVLEVDPESIDATVAGYKTARALRRVPIHRQLADIGFLDFWEHQKAQGHDRPFPTWPQHRKAGQDGVAEIHYEGDFFNAHRVKWGVRPERQRRLTFHSFRYFFTQACHDADIDPYTVLKMVGHDEDTEARTSKVHRGYLDKDLTEDEIDAIDRVRVPLGKVTPFRTLLAAYEGAGTK
jgi:integrase